MPGRSAELSAYSDHESERAGGRAARGAPAGRSALPSPGQPAGQRGTVPERPGQRPEPAR